ncbi:MAG: glutamate--tRNA ligase [Candidatus Moraniibacteriota bacterium]
METYRHYALELIEKGAAYYCFCTEERLTRLREEQTKEKRPTGYDGHCRALDEELIKNNLEKRTPFVIRFKIPEGRGTITFTDEIRGKVAIEASALDDHVLLKSDGYPTYHLASVVDDHLMEISHVVRGEDWLPSTPKHILLYEAFGWTIPLYAHLPLILNEDKTKLSKRKGDKSIDGFLERGYLKEAILNFVALLGWNPGKGSTEEFFTLDELTQVFDFSQVNKSGAVFDSKKLDWMNHHYIMKKTPQELLSLLQEGKFLEEKGYYQEAPADRKLDAFLLKVIAVEQERLTTLFEVGENTPFFFKETLSYPVALLAWKENSQEQTKEALAKAIEILEKVGEGEWARENLAKTLLEMAGDKKGDFLWPLRVALTGAECSPSPMDVAWVLGKATSLKRIQRALSLFEAL